MSEIILDKRGSGRVTGLLLGSVLLRDPLQCLLGIAFVIGSHLGMHEQSNCGYDPSLPVMRGDHCDALDLLLVIFYETDVFFQCFHIFPTSKAGGVNQ